MDWQSKLNSSTKLNQLMTIPVAHNANMYGPLNCNESMSWLAHRCQHFTITEQLNAGVRGLHIDISNFHNIDNHIVNMYTTRVSLKDVIDNVKVFLMKNYKEFVFIILSSSNAIDAQAARSIWAMFGTYSVMPASDILQKRIGDLHGKIIPIVGSFIEPPRFGYIHTKQFDTVSACNTLSESKDNIQQKLKTIKFGKYRYMELFIPMGYFGRYLNVFFHNWIKEQIIDEWHSKRLGFVCVDHINNEMSQLLYLTNTF